MDPVLNLSSLNVSRIKEGLSCSLVAIITSTGVYGITVLQACLYFRSSSQDSTLKRSFVAFLFILDSASLALAVDALYEYIVVDFGKTSLLFELPRALAFENGMTYLIGTLTQCFFAHRLWALSRGNVPLVSTIVALSLVSFGIAIVICVRNYKYPEVSSLASFEMRFLIGLSNGLSVPCDVLITAALSYYLHSKRTGFKRTDSIINRLIIYAVNRGALTAICQAGLTIVFVTFPGRLFHFPFDLLSGKLYCNTLLATYVILGRASGGNIEESDTFAHRLNAQRAMRGDGKNVMDVNTLVLRRKSNSTAQSGNSRRVPWERAGRSTPTCVN
ncbi:hypothetical protein V8D89_010519 [Ganoderma adspersum]